MTDIICDICEHYKAVYRCDSCGFNLCDHTGASCDSDLHLSGILRSHIRIKIMNKKVNNKPIEKQHSFVRQVSGLYDNSNPKSMTPDLKIKNFRC